MNNDPRTESPSGPTEKEGKADDAKGELTDPTVLGDQAKLILDAMTDTVVVMDSEGLIRHINQAAEAMFGYRAEELLGESVQKLMPHPVDAKHPGYLRDYLNTGIAKIMGIGRELLARKSSGESFPVHLVTTETERAGERIFVGVMRDLSSAGESNRLVSQQRAQLAETGRLITMGELTASFSHEVNQPLAAITMYAQACKRLLDKDNLERAKIVEVLDKMTDQVLRAGEIIESVQHFVKSGSRERTVINLNQIVAEIQHLIIADALLQDIEIQFDLTPEILSVRCNTGQIQQIVLNLLRNSIEAMGEIECSNGSQITLSSEKRDTFARVVVDDMGAGIAEKQLPYMFSAFHSTKSNGVGLGLSICKSIVEDHRGELWFENKPDRAGCRFYFELPIG